MKLKEEDNIDCYLQKEGLGSLSCEAIVNSDSNDVDAEQCFSCEVGKIYRDVGCDAASAKIYVGSSTGGTHYSVGDIFCKKRKRNTTLEYCRTCTLVTAETTRELVSKVRGLFQAHGFNSAYKDIEKARESYRDGNYSSTITSSLSSVESVIKIIHEKLDEPLPSKKQLTDLWKSVKNLLEISKLDETESTKKVLGSLSGLVTNIASLRNSLSSAHGHGNKSSEVSEIIAELAINTSATLSTTLIRQFTQI